MVGSDQSDMMSCQVSFSGGCVVSSPPPLPSTAASNSKNPIHREKNKKSVSELPKQPNSRVAPPSVVKERSVWSDLSA